MYISDKRELQGKVAVVTGAAGGIGSEICLALARHGATIVACDFESKSLRELEAAVLAAKVPCHCRVLDITDTQAVRRTMAEVTDELGRIDILVNSAGICTWTAVPDVTEEEWDKVFAVNLRGLFFCCQAVMPIMKERKSGRIINISSLAGFVGGIQSSPAYSASKAGVTCLTKSLASHLAPFGITVNAVAPGTAQTAMVLSSRTEAELAVLKAKIPLGRLALPSDVASAVLFLASDAAGFITGQTLHVNGGMLMW